MHKQAPLFGKSKCIFLAGNKATNNQFDKLWFIIWKNDIIEI